MWSVEHYFAVALSIILLTVTLRIYKYWRINRKSNGLLLPPGSSGLPLIGESLELLIPTYNFDILPFLKKRMLRYGPVFRTNVAGHNLIVSTDADFNHFLFQQEGKLVVRCYMDLFDKVFEQSKFEEVSIHKFTRNVTLSQFGVDSIKQNLLSDFEEFGRKTLHFWSLQDSVEVKPALAEMFGEFGAKQLFSNDMENSRELSHRFFNFAKASMAFPLNIPGTLYHKCLKEKKEALNMIRQVVKGRLANSPQNIKDDDLLSKIIKDLDKLNFRSEEFITQMVFGSSFTAFETVPTILEFALKFISENPAVQHKLIAEHEGILKKRQKSDSLVTWEEYKSMTFTLQVVNETLRLANTTPGFLRKAVKDIQVNGYTIPAGWRIMICQSSTHLDPTIYKDPLTFNPWRWEDVNSEFISKNLRPFGGGIKQCAGADYSRASMSIFLHLLVTKYRWNTVKGGDIIQNPILHFQNGLHISLHPKAEIKTPY
ncbi:Cytochrome P450 CYP4/CYP19/CYP26 subfamily [Handroanthus impetiginosus]|uniref:Cytochrome P450 CYP4/CYP19/CYP26 subfamily n=1 Tax=Handroanthus impetiginosus TaxID=429701 RepID=A0A2G9I7M1_9LAMI|nr:Cytochrome P450 CYP4/CYP19/CYP26 subfamily [Handroanthus impetiginosus]